MPSPHPSAFHLVPPPPPPPPLPLPAERRWPLLPEIVQALPAAGRWYSDGNSKSGRKQPVRVAASAAVEEEAGGNGSERIIETELRLEAERSYLSVSCRQGQGLLATSCNYA